VIAIGAIVRWTDRDCDLAVRVGVVLKHGRDDMGAYVSIEIDDEYANEIIRVNPDDLRPTSPLSAREIIVLRALYRADAAISPLAVPIHQEDVAKSLAERGLLEFDDGDPRYPSITWCDLTGLGRLVARGVL
jgi:hypothetical protein